MSRLRKLIKEALSIPPKKNCDCSCSTKITAPILKKNKFVYTSISEGLQYHIDNKIPLSNNIYRVGTKEYMELYKEARSLYSRNRLNVSEEDKYILTETNIGDFGIFEGKKVPLGIPMLNEGYDAYDEIAQAEFSMDYDQLGPNEQEWVRDEYDKQPSGRDSIKENIEENKLNEAKNFYQDIVDMMRGFRLLKIQSPKRYKELDQKFKIGTIERALTRIQQYMDRAMAKGFIRDSKLNEDEATGEELKREYDNILSREADLTRIYQNDRTEENWGKLVQFRQKGRNLEKKLAKMGLIDSYLAEIVSSKPKQSNCNLYYVYIKEGNKVKKMGYKEIKENQGTLSSNMLDYADQYHMELVDTMKGVSTFPDKRTEGFYIRFPHYNGPDYTGATFGKDVVNQIEKSKASAKGAAQKTISKFKDYIEDYEITDSKSGVYGDVWLWVMPKDKKIDMDRVFMKGVGPGGESNPDQLTDEPLNENNIGNKINKARAKSHFKMGEKIAVVHKVTKNVMPIEDIRQIDTFDTNKYDFAYLVESKLNENKNNKVNFVKRLLQRIDMGFGTMPLSEYQIQRIIEELFRHKIIQ